VATDAQHVVLGMIMPKLAEDLLNDIALGPHIRPSGQKKAQPDESPVAML
jgi:hypothetical protein